MQPDTNPSPTTEPSSEPAPSVEPPVTAVSEPAVPAAAPTPVSPATPPLPPQSAGLAAVAPNKSPQTMMMVAVAVGLLIVGVILLLVL